MREYDSDIPAGMSATAYWLQQLKFDAILKRHKITLATAPVTAPAPVVAPVVAPEPVVDPNAPVFAPDSTWIPDDLAYYEQLQTTLRGKKRDYRFRPVPLTDYPSILSTINLLNNDETAQQTKIQTSITERNKHKYNTDEYKKLDNEVDEHRLRLKTIIDNKNTEIQRKLKMENWKPKNKVVFSFNYDGYKPEEIIKKLPTGNVAKQLEWVINERSKMMKEVNKQRGNPIRMVYFYIILTDSADKVFIQCTWEIHRFSNDNQGYYEDIYHHFIEEYKIVNDSDTPTKFQSEETLLALKTKQDQEAESARLKEEAKANNGLHKDFINGHPITYRGKSKKNGTYDDLYSIDTDFTNNKEIKTIMENEAVKSIVEELSNVKIAVKINRIDTVAKKFYWNIIGFTSGYGGMGLDDEKYAIKFTPYNDGVERESKTTVKQGALNIPLDKMSSAYEVPALEIKKAEVIKPEGGGDGMHHFQKYGFNVTSSNDKKASMKNAIYDDFVRLRIYKNMIDKDRFNDAKITGFTKQDYEEISKPEARTYINQRTKEEKQEMYDTVDFELIARWTDKSKGEALIVGYFNKDTKKSVALDKNFAVQFTYRNKKYNGFEKMKVEEYDLSGLTGKV